MKRIKLHRLLLELRENLVSVEQVKTFISNNYRRRKYKVKPVVKFLSPVINWDRILYGQCNEKLFDEIQEKHKARRLKCQSNKK